MVTMKYTQDSDGVESSSSKKIKSAILKKKSNKLKMPKLVVQNKKQFDGARMLLQKVNDSELSISNQTSRELSLSDIMRAIKELTSEEDATTKDITECSDEMIGDPNIFWNSPTVILRAIKNAILRRDWDNITHLLLLLLQHKDQYVLFVKQVSELLTEMVNNDYNFHISLQLCRFIGKFNPMIKEFGLKEEFESLNDRKK